MPGAAASHDQNVGDLGVTITRVYADSASDSHFTDMTIPLRDAGKIGHLSELTPAKGLIFRLNEAGYDYNWHTAPQRQYIVLLDGVIEIEVSDGTRRTFRGGDVLLMEDTHGKGHRTRHLEKRERRSLFIVLDRVSSRDG
jgi:hypothetical protein